MEDKHVWDMALERLHKEVNTTTYEWLAQARLTPTQATNKFILQVGSTSVARILTQRALLQIERAVTEAVGIKEKVSVTITLLKAGKANSRAAQPEQVESLFPEVADMPRDDHDAPKADIMPARGPRLTQDERRRQRSMRYSHPDAGRPQQPMAATSTSATISLPSPRRASGPSQGTVPTLDPVKAEIPAWLNSQYTFDTYIVGAGNNFAYAACMAVADAPGNSYNPLFLYGGVGLGKTHLLHAIAHAVAPRGFRTLYVTSETFTNEIINAIRYRTTEEFRAKYRSVDVLLIDDVQFIAGKESTEEEFFHTFNALHESHKQIVICSDRPPKEIDLEERLRSRFEWGLIADIQPPDLETRLAILRAKAEVICPDIDEEVLNYLGERLQTNVRQLEGILNRVAAYAKMQQVPLTIDIAKQAMASIGPVDKQRKRVTFDEILLAVSNYYHISIDDLRGKQRDKHIVMPRQIAMWLMRTDTEAPLVDVGNALGGRDHSTILHGCDKIERELKREGSPLVQEVAAIRQQIAG